jgi:hypothetical protein
VVGLPAFSKSSAPRFSSFLLHLGSTEPVDHFDRLFFFYYYHLGIFATMKVFGMNGSQEPTLEEVHDQQARRPSAVEVVAEQARRKSIDNRIVTGASQLTARQSIVPVALVTTL